MLSAAILAAILSLPGVHGDRPRLEADARAIASASESSNLFGGPLGSSMALVAIAQHESGFASDVETCKRTGDGGRSVSLFQLQGPWAWDGHTRAEVCSSVTLAASLALSVLSRHSKCTPRGIFMAYASGDCARKSDAGEALYQSWVRLTAKVAQ